MHDSCATAPRLLGRAKLPATKLVSRVVYHSTCRFCIFQVGRNELTLIIDCGRNLRARAMVVHYSLSTFAKAAPSSDHLLLIVVAGRKDSC